MSISSPSSTKNVKWRHASYGFVPSEAVAGGHDVNGEAIYVGRTIESGELIPGKIVPSHGVLYVPFGGEEKAHSEYEYLVRPSTGSLHWVHSTGGEVPSDAVAAGHTGAHEQLFVGRAFFEGSWVLGKLLRSHHMLYIPFGGREVSISDYEVLVIKN